MNKKLAIWVVGGLVTASMFGLGVSPMIASAAEKIPQACETQTNQKGAMMENMDAKAMAQMVTSPEMQKQCIEMMKTPELQGIIKQMLQQDMSFHQMMSDLVNSVDMSSDHSDSQQVEQSSGNPSNDHSAHHG